MPLAAAVAGAAVISGGASLAASSKASKAAKKAAADSNALQRETYEKNAAILAPGTGQLGLATNRINALLNLTDSNSPGFADATKAFDDYKASTGYTFRLGQGEKALQASLGAKGLLDSGAAQKALLSYGQGAASDEFGRYLGYLGQQQGVGLTAASAQAGVGQNYANATSNNNNTAAAATGNAALSSANTISGVLGNLVGAYSFAQGGKGGTGSSYNAYGVKGSDGIV